MVSSNVGHGENLSFQASLRLMITDSTVFPLTSAGSGQVQAP
jgi:hypothetical protein